MKTSRFGIVATLLFALAASAWGQTSTVNPNIPAQGGNLTSAPIRGNFAAAVNDINALYATKLASTGGTMTGPLITAASAAAASGFNLPHGAPPTSPANGDVWTTTSGLFARINGTTVGPYVSAASSGVTVGASTITGGVNTRVLFNNVGVLGEYTAVQLTAQINQATASLAGTVPAFPNNTTTFLRGDLTWAAPAVTGVANPSAPVGLLTVNGSATTALRSDSAPALSQAINPTWTAPHNWNVTSIIASATAATLRDLNVAAATTTITGNSGSPITAIDKVYIGQPTIADASAVTITDASTVYIDNAPTQAGSATITNPWALRVGAGNVKFPGTGNSVGTITAGTWNGTAIDLTHGGTNNNGLVASNGGVVYSDATKLQILAGTVTASQCLLSGSSAAPTWGSCSGAAAVSAVANSDGTLTISPTTGSVTASLALGHANTWTAAQDQTLSTNGGFAPTISNTNAGVNAFAAINTTNGTNNFEFGTTGVNYTAIPLLANRGFGLVVGTDLVLATFTAAKAILFGVASAEVGRWSGATPGELDLGVSATTAGAIKMFGSASGSTILKPTAAAGSTTATLQAATGTLALLDVADQTVSGGANVTSQSLSTGNVTIDCGSRPLQFITNGGAFTITAPANDGSCMLLVTNNATANTITFAGFTVGSSTGDPFTNTNGNKFLVSIARVNGISTYINKALQ